MKKIRINQKMTNTDSKSVSKYMVEVSRISQFKDVHAEYECAVKASNGDEKSFNELVTRNLRFVITVAKQYATPKLKLEDLINQGNMGLIEAAKRYDTTKGIKFITHAVWWIRKEIMEFINETNRTVRVPLNKLNDYNSLLKEAAKLEKKSFDLKIGDKIYDEYASFVDKEIAMVVGPGSSSLDAKMGDTENDFTNVLASKGLASDTLIFDEGEALLTKVLNTLTEVEQEAITLTYGIGRGFPMSLKDVSKEMGISNERIRQLNIKSILKMKKIAVKLGAENFNF